MRVKVIMMPLKDVKCIAIDDTIGKAMDMIDQYGLLSLPVVEGKQFIGVLSKQHTYESYFKDYTCSKEEYLALPVKELMKSKIQTVEKEMRIEEAAALFISSKVRFIPVTDEKGNLEGIITQQAVFKYYQKLFGSNYNTLTILCHDYKGAFAKICELIAKAGGNIKNIVNVDTEVMGIQEFFLRVETDDFDRVIKELQKNKYDVRHIHYANKQS
ncbi:MAG: acetoin utilization protein AcuB [Clostridiales bacterium]|nr:acetoin utilization protein AcuB [Clostridiales bacterium]